MKHKKNQNFDLKIAFYMLFAVLSPFIPSMFLLPAGIEEFALQTEKHAKFVAKEFPQKEELLLKYADCDENWYQSRDSCAKSILDERYTEDGDFRAIQQYRYLLKKSFSNYVDWGLYRYGINSIMPYAMISSCLTLIVITLLLRKR